jgi:hypothetical protein
MLKEYGLETEQDMTEQRLPEVFLKNLRRN